MDNNMSQEKRTKKRVESKKDREQASKTTSSSSAAPKKLQEVMNFDAYFQHLMGSSAGKIQLHHKAPMRQFAEAHKLVNGTKEEFDKVFRLY